MIQEIYEKLREEANASHNLCVVQLANKGNSPSEIEKIMIARQLGWNNPRCEFIRPAKIAYDIGEIGKIN